MAYQETMKQRSKDNFLESRDDLKILVVEDNLMICQLIGLILDSFHCRLTLADNGKIALEKLQTSRFDLILMDLYMPEMNGLEATSLIRSMERETGEHIPILAMTGFPLRNGYEYCINAGMDDYLTKPFDITDFLGAIERLTHIKLEELVQ
jgi:two-component system, sensor histidine kinase and response regulator